VWCDQRGREAHDAQGDRRSVGAGDAARVATHCSRYGRGHRTNPGPGYNLTRDRQLGYLMDFCLRFKAIGDRQEQQELLKDPWRMRDFADAVGPGVPVREMRHILLHLLFPDEFERISSHTLIPQCLTSRSAE
jgi:5-methylcytosine-specific restriction protein B